MGTMQDALKAHMEEITTVTAANTVAQTQTVNGEIVTKTEQLVSPAPVPVVDMEDEDGLAAIIRARMARRQQFVASRDSRDAGLRQNRERGEKNEVNLRDLYRERSEVEKLLQEEILKLSEAKTAHFGPHDLAVLRVGVEELTEDFASIKGTINALEAKYPDIKAKLAEERHVVVLRQQFLERFAKEIGNDGMSRYIAKGTPNPSAASVKDMDAFFKKGIREAENLGVIVSVPKGEPAAFVAHDGSRWNPGHPEISEGAEVCKELGIYEKAIQGAEQEKLKEWADKDAAAGLLLTPSQTEAQKKSLHNRHSLLNLVRFGEGFCFVSIESKRPAELLSYSSVRPEMKVEYGDNKEGNKKHMLRVTSVTAPQFVEDFFFPEGSGGKCVTPMFDFDDLREVTTWRINALIRDSLTKGIRRAESWEKKTGVMKELSDINRVSNIKTLDQLSDGAAGTAVVYAPKSKYSNNTFDIGFEVVSDGVTVRPGPLAIDYSRKLPVYEEIMDGKPVAEFFARAKDGSFCNKNLQELARRNEAFELSWLIPAAATEYTAEEVSADNVAGLVMLSEAGGRGGTYVFKVSVKDKRKEDGDTEAYRQVAYAVRRESDTLVFIAGLTRYSADRFTEQGFAFNTPYALALGELRGFILHILRRIYIKVSDMPFDKLPEHLKSARA